MSPPNTSRPLAVALALTAFACSSPQSEVTPQPAARPSTEAPAGTASASALAASARAAPAPPIPSSTPGAIHCGTARCQLGTELCCLDESTGEGRCIPKQGDPTKQVRPCAGDGETARSCDEHADCGDGGRCCPFACDNQCPLQHVCQRDRCTVPSEICLPNGSCSQGFACRVPAHDQPSPVAYCKLAHPGASCGDSRCGGDTPVCMWNLEAKAGRCVDAHFPDRAFDPSAGDTSVFHCTSPADCSGYTCAAVFHMGMPFTAYRCMGEEALAPRAEALCAAVADCPRRGKDRPRACKADPESLPPGVKRCFY